MQERKKFKRIIPDEININSLTPLDVTCGATKCNEGFHCYSKKKTSIKKFGEQRACKECGENLVDWKRVHKNDINDVSYIFQELQHEVIRHVFFHTPIEEAALLKALQHGKLKTEERVKNTLKSRIGKLTAWEGRQTPMGGDELINYAQHATATCCRSCLEAWHNIKMDDDLSDAQMEFCVALVMKFIENRLPFLNDIGINKDEASKIIKDEIYKH